MRRLHRAVSGLACQRCAPLDPRDEKSTGAYSINSARVSTFRRSLFSHRRYASRFAGAFGPRTRARAFFTQFAVQGMEWVRASRAGLAGSPNPVACGRGLQAARSRPPGEQLGRLLLLAGTLSAMSCDFRMFSAHIRAEECEATGPSFPVRGHLSGEAHCLAQAVELKLAGHSVHSRPSDLHCVGIHAYREGPVPGEEVECAEVAIRRAQAMSTSKWKRMFP
jgi:hypothetical protein